MIFEAFSITKEKRMFFLDVNGDALVAIKAARNEANLHSIDPDDVSVAAVLEKDIMYGILVDVKRFGIAWVASSSEFKTFR